jgi:hypothetical protein
LKVPNAARFGTKFVVVGPLHTPCGRTVRVADLDLRAGDIGAVVDVYSREALEVEFVGPTGTTRALVTLPKSAVRKIHATDVMTVRRSA